MNEESIVIVIDPGHGGLGGGSDDGACYNGIRERDINIATAKALYEELSKYDNVKVYLTHDSSEQAMTLRQRAEFASGVGADYLISIHYNASEEHMIYGSEVWIPSIGEYYTRGYGIAKAVLSELEGMGLYIKGVKTRVGEGGDEYYGIIRESEKLNITGIIIEHCYIDNGRDYVFYNNNECYMHFGNADATGIAKALGLKSTELGKDYTAYKDLGGAVPTARVYQDVTPPEVILKECGSDGNGTIQFTIYAQDMESEISYYSYSFDGGATYSELFEWNDRDNNGEETIIIMNVGWDRADIVVRAYNNYNLYSESQTMVLNGINGVVVMDDVPGAQENIPPVIIEESQEAGENIPAATANTSPDIEESTSASAEATSQDMEETTSDVMETMDSQEETTSVLEENESGETAEDEESIGMNVGINEENSVFPNEKVWYDNRRTGAVIVVTLFIVVVVAVFFKSVLAATIKKGWNKAKNMILKNRKDENRKDD